MNIDLGGLTTKRMRAQVQFGYNSSFKYLIELYLTVCVTCWWAGRGQCSLYGEYSRQKNLNLAERVPPVKCTRC